MNRIGIITFHRAENYGAVLQTYALCKTLDKMGAEVEVFDYRATAIENEYKLINWMGGTLSDKVKRLCLSIVRYWIARKRKQVFSHFSEEYLPTSKPVTTADLTNQSAIYSALITGSDQVFNPAITKEDCRNYFLSFAKMGTACYSYAASFGGTVLSEADALIIKPELERFDAISVRERSGAEIVYNLTGRKAEVHLDPVLLLTKEEWGSICTPIMEQTPYILLYVIVSNQAVYQYANEISKKTSLPVICINGSLKARIKYWRFHYVDAVPPETFLTFVRDAKYVITSSFHGTAFSILFEKQFAVVVPKGYQRNDRIISLLRWTGLESQATDCPQIFSSIDWDEVKRRLVCNRDIALSYLKGIAETNE